MTKIYDFSDWEIGSDINIDFNSLISSHLKLIVQANLRQAFKDFSDGYWNAYKTAPAIQWHVMEWDTYPVNMSITPSDLKTVFTELVDDELPRGGIPGNVESREAIGLVLGHIAEWRAALDAVEAYAKEVLAREP